MIMILGQRDLNQLGQAKLAAGLLAQITYDDFHLTEHISHETFDSAETIIVAHGFDFLVLKMSGVVLGQPTMKDIVSLAMVCQMSLNAQGFVGQS